MNTIIYIGFLSKRCVEANGLNLFQSKLSQGLFVFARKLINDNYNLITKNNNLL